MNKYFITMEWDEGCRPRVALYGRITKEDIQWILDCQKRYSPYDYVDSCSCETREEYNALIENIKNENNNALFIDYETSK